ncbi:MAG: DNA-directed RNA polymerase subunit alpha [Thermoanaerobaculia bacterium]|nr:DNA-directed RNA polymerase subunit alpha [Thermoanaerobaculia bacterium]
MLWKGFQRPKRVDIESTTATPTYAKFIAQPFERGFATTVGNALRRCLLSSIEGAAVTAVHIEGVLHEFSSLSGVQEDITDLLLNLRQVPIKLASDEPKFLSVDMVGPKTVKAGDLTGDPAIEICDPGLPVATLNEEGRLKMQVQVCRGRGYVTADKNFDEAMGIGWMPIDSVHSPVRRVNYRVEAARVGRATDYERLILEIWTNGTMAPDEALSLAAMLLRDHLSIFTHAEESMRDDAPLSHQEELSERDKLLGKGIEELDLSVRSANCLKNANINTLRDLVRKTEKEMLETKNFGRKSLEELQEVLGKLGLQFGMNVPERPPGRMEMSA